MISNNESSAAASSLDYRSPQEFVIMMTGSITGRPESCSLSLGHPTQSFQPMAPAGAVENANSAFPTAPWTVRTARRLQAPQLSS